MEPASRKTVTSSLSEMTINPDIDESLYSRQMYVLGKEAMGRMCDSHVFVSGMCGLGVEICKNVILSGVKSVTLHDHPFYMSSDNSEGAVVQGQCQWEDLSSNFCITPSDVQERKSRVEVSAKYLKELNPYVQVDVLSNFHSSQLTLEFLSKSEFKVVVLAEGFQSLGGKEETLRLSSMCHELGICFILCETRGVFSRVFCDFGAEFTVLDPSPRGSGVDESIPKTILHISNSESGVVSVTKGANHGLTIGDFIQFSNMKNGMTELDGQRIKVEQVLNSSEFTIDNTSDYSKYNGGGSFVPVKMPRKITHEKLSEFFKHEDDKNSNKPQVSLTEKMMITDWPKYKNSIQIHLLFQAMDEFVEKFKKFPEFEDFHWFYAKAKEISIAQTKVEKIDEELAKAFIFSCTANLAPISAFIGGFVGQEVLKAVTRKFIPLSQWLFYDAVECLPNYENPLKAPENTKFRYAGQTLIFDEKFQEGLSNLKLFVVGAGAIGGELLKNFALMGVGSGSEGKIILTDMDHIEKSNLNRQFLFRPRDVGQSKSKTAAAAIRRMNPEIRIIAQENQVGEVEEEMEGKLIYDDEFYQGLDAIVLAVDNLKARLFLDEMSIKYSKPMLDSGTNGTQGNTQVIIPERTKTYSSMQNPTTRKEIPLCTLKNFPNSIHHTLQWAREKFEEYFKLIPENIRIFMNADDFSKWEKNEALSAEEKFSMLKSIQQSLCERPSSFSDCVLWAARKFSELYTDEISQLLKSYPPNSTTSDGQPFWTKEKLCPTPLNLQSEISADSHEGFAMDFVRSAAHLMAQVYQISIKDQENEDAQILSIIQNHEHAEVQTPETEIKEEEITDETLQNLISLMPSAQDYKKDLLITPLEFEKDDDTNFHMDFITAASNLRAKNYGISPADRFQSKLVAGRIIPALATTTSVVAGLISLELIKLVDKERRLEASFKDCFLNLSLPMISHVGVSKAPILHYNQKEYTIWSRFEVHGELTVRGFLDFFAQNHLLNISFISYGGIILFSSVMDDGDEDLMNKTMKQALVDACSSEERNARIQGKFIDLHIQCSNVGPNENVPPVRYYFS